MLKVDFISMVPRGANPEARIVLAKHDASADIPTPTPARVTKAAQGHPDGPLCIVCKHNHPSAITALSQETRMNKTCVYGAEYTRVSKQLALDTGRPAGQTSAFTKLEQIAKALIEDNPMLTMAGAITAAADKHYELVTQDRDERRAQFSA